MAKKDASAVVWNGMPTNEATLKEIKGAVVGLYEQLHTIDEMKAEIKEVFDDLHARTGIPRRVFNFLMKSEYAGSGYETIQKNSELEEAFEALSRVSL